MMQYRKTRGAPLRMLATVFLVVFHTLTVVHATEPLSASVELSSLNGVNGFTINVGDSRPYASGREVSVSSLGDVNGDDIDDIVVGSAAATAGGKFLAGQVYVVFGRPEDSTFDPTLEYTDLDGTNGFVINGIAAYDQVGQSVADAGDINGDLVNDIVIGAPSAGSGATGNGPGQSYVVFGRQQGSAFPQVLELADLNGTNGFRITGEQPGDDLGQSVAGAGDINSDGVDDLIIGARRYQSGRLGFIKCYVLFGKNTSFDADFDLSSLSGAANGFVINGLLIDSPVSPFTSVAKAGDINGDDRDDVIIGAREVSPSGVSTAGQSYVIFGRPENSTFDAVLELANLDGTDGFRINGTLWNELSGQSVAGTGDVNGDDIDDFIIGAANANQQRGRSYVVFGSTNAFPAEWPLSSLDGSNGFVIEGIAEGDLAGVGVSGAGDFNRDGVADILVGAKWADPNGVTRAGQSYVVFGRPTERPFPAVFSLQQLDGDNGFALNGSTFQNRAGAFVSEAGDFDNDGRDDLILGMFGDDAPDDMAQSYVVFGRGVPNYRFVVLADSRGDGGPDCLQHQLDCIDEPALRRIFTSIRDDVFPPPDFVMFVGDMVNGAVKNGAQVFTELNQWIDVIDDVMGSGYVNSMIYPVFGGHEENNTGPGYPKEWSAFDEAFFANGVDQREIPRVHFDTASQDFGPTVYYFDYENARFFILNNHLPAHELGPEQFDWLRELLENENNRKELNFLFHHEPAYGTLAHYPDPVDNPEFTMDAKTFQRNRYIELLGDPENNVSMIFAGHEHQYSRRRINQAFANRSENIPGDLVIIATAKSTATPPISTGPRTAESYDGSPSKAPRLWVKYEVGGAEKIFEARISSSQDDAEEFAADSSIQRLTSSDLEFMLDLNDGLLSHVGMRWTGVSIPKGADVLEAYIYFTVDERGTASAEVTFRGQDADQTQPFTNADRDISSRSVTSASVDWNILAWDTPGQEKRSPDISAIIQEIIDRPQWGDSVSFSGEFQEVKTGSSGARWYNNFHRVGNLFYVPGDSTPWDLDRTCSNDLETTCTGTGIGTCVSPGICDTHNQPDHYAVVHVFQNKVTLKVYGVNKYGIRSTSPIDAIAFSSEIPLPVTLDTNQSGDPDAARIDPAIGSGELGILLSTEQLPDQSSLSNVSTGTDHDVNLDQTGKPQKDFELGLYSGKITGLAEGDSADVTLDLPYPITEHAEYYEAGTWQVMPFTELDGGNKIVISLTDGGVGDLDGEADGTISHSGGLATPQIDVINRDVKYRSLRRTYKLTRDISGCVPQYDFTTIGGKFVGKANFMGRLKNKRNSNAEYSDLSIRVRRLSYGNLLQNSDVRPEGEGARLHIQTLGQYGDGILSPGEIVYVPITICLRKWKPFRFRVDVEGRLQ